MTSRFLARGVKSCHAVATWATCRLAVDSSGFARRVLSRLESPVVHRFTTLEVAELARIVDLAAVMSQRISGETLPEAERWADRLFDEVVDAWCTHCDSAPASRRGMCDACSEYERRTGTLPAVEVIRKRLQRTG